MFTWQSDVSKRGHVVPMFTWQLHIRKGGHVVPMFTWQLHIRKGGHVPIFARQSDVRKRFPEEQTTKYFVEILHLHDYERGLETRAGSNGLQRDVQ